MSEVSVHLLTSKTNCGSTCQISKTLDTKTESVFFKQLTQRLVILTLFISSITSLPAPPASFTKIIIKQPYWQFVLGKTYTVLEGIYYIDISNTHFIATADSVISDESMIFNLVLTIQKHSIQIEGGKHSYSYLNKKDSIPSCSVVQWNYWYMELKVYKTLDL